MEEYNNLSDEEKKNYDLGNLGKGVELVGYNKDDGSVDLSQALTSSSYKFDGIDDYIKIKYNDENQKKRIKDYGFTFEFYGKIKDGKSYKSDRESYEDTYGGLFGYWNGNEENQAMFRCGIYFNQGAPRLLCSANANLKLPYNFGDTVFYDPSVFYSPSMIQGNYWNYPISFDSNYLNDDVCITVTLDPTEEIEYDGKDLEYQNKYIAEKLYFNGKLYDTVLYNLNLWNVFSTDLIQNLEYFCVGRCSMAAEGWWHYIEGDCYSLRFYSESLSSEQVKDNYLRTIDYHNLLVSGN